MRRYASAEMLEKRRRRAMRRLDEGLSLHEVARRVGCHPSSVMRWRNTWKREGDEGLNPKPVPGRPARLTSRQRKRLVRLLEKGAMPNGYRADLWTTLRVTEVIERAFGVRYHRDHMGRVLRSLGWTYQKPERNPDEGVWAILKHTLANGRPNDRKELWAHLLDALHRLRGSPRRLRGCIHHSDLPFFSA